MSWETVNRLNTLLIQIARSMILEPALTDGAGWRWSVGQAFFGLLFFQLFQKSNHDSIEFFSILQIAQVRGVGQHMKLGV